MGMAALGTAATVIGAVGSLAAVAIPLLTKPSTPSAPAAPPPLAAPKEMPVQDVAATTRAQQAQTMLASQTSGRASTLLSQVGVAGTDKLGG